MRKLDLENEKKMIDPKKKGKNAVLFLDFIFPHFAWKANLSLYEFLLENLI